MCEASRTITIWPTSRYSDCGKPCWFFIGMDPCEQYGTCCSRCRSRHYNCFGLKVGLVMVFIRKLVSTVYHLHISSITYSAVTTCFVMNHSLYCYYLLRDSWLSLPKLCSLYIQKDFHLQSCCTACWHCWREGFYPATMKCANLQYSSVVLFVLHRPYKHQRNVPTTKQTQPTFRFCSLYTCIVYMHCMHACMSVLSAFLYDMLHSFEKGFDGFFHIVSMIPKGGDANRFVRTRDHFHFGNRRTFQRFTRGCRFESPVLVSFFLAFQDGTF